MATNAKTNGQSKKETTTPKKAVQKQLAEEAKGQTPSPIKDESKTNVSLDARIDKFEKLRGIATQRERLVYTLTQLSRFNYNSADSSTFTIKDAAGLEFKTTNSNLIKLVSSELQNTLEARKSELEKQLIEFEL